MDAGDHPRIRGENADTFRLEGQRKGSPPHTRGELSSRRKKPRKAGITPAYAGRIVARAVKDSFHWDHPRIRGENNLAHPQTPFRAGSPPHTRGEY